ncbi:MAG TPA: ammonium transporter [Candidatus Limnocylindrales bacterium]|jgi:Amt family ammonium transporter|nr:ammonium transporter [Candidatus Limnocylindrales bacterium]
MRKLYLLTGLLTAILLPRSILIAADASAPKRAEPTLEQRIADLEAYVNNTARAADTTNNVSSKLGAYDEKSNSFSPNSGPGANAWQMTSAALVLFMTLPGLALFYGGLVRRKNVLSVMAQCLFITGLVTILWWICGYSLVFHNGSSFLGNLGFAFLNGVDSSPNTDYSYWVSQNVFAMYQLMFAIITPALIIGAIAERMKFAAICLFMTLWMFVVYFPQAHMVWGIDGLMNGVWNANASIKAIDFAGGTVVHMTSGWSALILCLILGKRLGFGKEPMPPHSMVLCMVGTGMLWVGWYGFNAGSAVAADGIAANAFTTTTLATAVASFVWPLAEWIVRGKPSVLGFCSGAVAGLVVITPACGFVTPSGAVIIGIFAGLVPWFFCFKVKSWFGYDDALDTFGVHAVGGTMGALLTGLLARNVANANLATNLKTKVTDTLFQPLVLEQIKAILLTLVLAVVGTTIIAYIVKATVGLRASPEVETTGLDLTEHGEEAYHIAEQM